MPEPSFSKHRLPVVGVMGSGSSAQEPLASLVGAALADLGVHLLTGGGQGVMASVSRGFFGVRHRRGLVLGVIPGDEGTGDAPEGYPNKWVEIAVRTHLSLSGKRGTEPGSRNHLNILTSDVVVALPGGAGTRSEIELAVRYDRPIIAFAATDAEAAVLPAGVPTAQSLEGLIRFVRLTLVGLSS